MTSSFESPAYTPSDQALLMGLEAAEHEAKHAGHGTCPGCALPVELAWHSELNGWWEIDSYACEACSARKGERVTYTRMRNTWPAERPLPPFELGVTTSEA